MNRTPMSNEENLILQTNNKVDAELVESDTAELLITELSRALHNYGVAAHDLEESMSETAAVLGVAASYFATPTSIFITLGGETEHRTMLLRVSPGEINLDKVCLLNSLQHDLVNGDIGLENALAELRSIVSARNRFGWRWTIASFALTGATAAVFFGGGWHEAGASFLLGLVVGCLSWATAGHRRAKNLLLPLSGLIVSIIAVLLSLFSPNVTSGIVTVSSLIILLPGLSLTVAMNELATENLASGSARITGAMSQLMLLGFGVALGRSLVSVVFQPIHNPPGEGLALVYVSISLLLAAAAFTVLFQARPHDFPWVCLAGFLAFYGAQLCTKELGPLAGPSIAAATLGLTSNLIARRRNQSTSVMLVPGLLLLVPGSVAFKSVTELLDKDPIHSFESAFTMILVAAAIVTGLLLANLLCPPNKRASSSA